MAILRSVDGRFYEIGDDSLSDYELDADRVRELEAEMDMQPSGPAPDLPPAEESPQVVIEIFGGDIGMDDGPPPFDETAAGDKPADPAA